MCYPGVDTLARTLTFTVALLQSVCNPHAQERAELAHDFTVAIRTSISVDTGYCVNRPRV